MTTCKRLPETEKVKLGEQIDEDIIRVTLKHRANRASSGYNGIPYEFRKMLTGDPGYQLKNKKTTTPKEHKQLDIVKNLTNVYVDVENHGIHPDSAFAKGWMCPLYNKKDNHEIVNYCPITLKNTNYKIYTKALSIKLAEVAHQVIHPNQAGFMLGWSIFNQVKLARMMINYAEVTEQNGLIMALDQEKAYNKITHDYLWRTLEKYNIHENFICTVRSLYESAETMVIINGMISSPFQVLQGVHQGDLLSCLLFNLAIEPLANLL
jgi:hypothetical protein